MSNPFGKIGRGAKKVVTTAGKAAAAPLKPKGEKVAGRAAQLPPPPPDAFERAPIRPGEIDQAVASMTVAQKVRLLMMDYGDVNVSPRTGSIIVNQTHLSAAGAPKLARGLAAAAQRVGAPVLVAADQEGGKVNRLKNLPATAALRFPSAEQMRSMSEAQIRAEGVKTGKALLTAGVNTLLGPVLDVASPGSLMERMDRSFGDNAADVTRRANAFVAGLREANPGLTVIAKHYPGYNVRGNSDIAVVSDPSSKDELEARRLPFDEVQGLDGVMVSSIRYTALDAEPACFSKAIIDDLRARQPDALVVTDDLYATALLSKEVGAYKEYGVLSARARRGDAASQAELNRLVARFPQLNDAAARRQLAERANQEIKANAQKAFLAGGDLLLMMDSSKASHVSAGLEELIARDPSLAPRLDAAAKRVLALAVRAGGSPPVV